MERAQEAGLRFGEGCVHETGGEGEGSELRLLGTKEETTDGGTVSIGPDQHAAGHLRPILKLSGHSRTILRVENT